MQGAMTQERAKSEAGATRRFCGGDGRQQRFSGVTPSWEGDGFSGGRLWTWRFRVGKS